MTAPTPARDSYRARLNELAQRSPEDSEDQAHWAKYLSVLISGYLEQSIKDVLFEYTAAYQAIRLGKYIEDTWPKSRGMKTSNILLILKQFDESWGESFLAWLNDNDQYKDKINSLIQNRHDIAHGKEANTTNVTLPSARTKLEIAFDLVDFLENLILPEEAEAE